jgi:hypothetical protein
MKKLFILMMLVANSVTAQTSEIYGLIGVPFGASKSECDSIILSRSHQRRIISNESYSISYDNVEYAEFNDCIALFKFNLQNKMYHGGIILKVAKDRDVFTVYRDMRSMMMEKYGVPETNYEQWKKPYDSSDEDTYGRSALKGGYVTFCCQWNNVPGMSSDTGRWIQLKMNSDDSVFIIVDDFDLSKEFNDAKKEKQKNDL